MKYTPTLKQFGRPENSVGHPVEGDNDKNKIVVDIGDPSCHGQTVIYEGIILWMNAGGLVTER